MKIARFTLQLFGINTYVVWDESTRECAIIDPGMTSEQEEQALSAFIERENLKVRHLINTHMHIDHAAGNEFVIIKYGVQPEGHRDDEELSRNFSAQSQMFMLPFEVKGGEITTYLEDGDEIHVGSGILKVLHVPGHSKGSIALYDADDGYLISGDALFEGSIGRTDLPGGSMPQLIDSIKTKLLILPDETVVFPGHGGETTIGNEKKYNPFLR